MKRIILFISLIALSSQIALAGGGGGCEIPILLRDKTVSCKGSFLSSSGIFSSSKSFSKDFTFDNEIDFDNGNADVNYLLYKTSKNSGYGNENLYLAAGCDDTAGSRVTAFGKQYIALGDTFVRFELGNGKNETGVMNIKSDIGSAQVRCILK